MSIWVFILGLFLSQAAETAEDPLSVVQELLDAAEQLSEDGQPKESIDQLKLALEYAEIALPADHRMLESNVGQLRLSIGLQALTSSSWNSLSSQTCSWSV